MRQKKTPHLCDKNQAIDFYQDRYAHGYMDEWAAERKQRIFAVIRGLGLPEEGEALDFGCGNGVGTDLIRQALPSGWRVFGTDISETAIKKAKSRYPDCMFFLSSDKEYVNARFDFLFTHHVLEHVYDLPLVLDEIDNHLEAESAMLHILPCGNEDSFEHGICLLRKDGIEGEQEGRFFFEDEGHVRRLNTVQLRQLWLRKGFVLAREYYRNQYHGAIDWITGSSPLFIWRLTDWRAASDERSKDRLMRLRHRLLAIWALRFPAVLVQAAFRRRDKRVRDYAFFAAGLPLYVFAKPIDSYLKHKALQEWEDRRADRSGSEMYLFFERVSTIG